MLAAFAFLCPTKTKPQPYIYLRRQGSGGGATNLALIGIWSLAVYAGSAALILLAARRWVLPVRPRCAVLLAAAPLLFTGKATVTGGIYAPLDILYFAEPFSSIRPATLTDARTPLLSDVVCSMLPWQKAVRDALVHGRLPLWNPFLLAGEPLLAAQQGAVLHPATWIGLLLPLKQAWTLQMSLRLLVALLAAYLLARDLGCGETASLVAAVAWGFSDFVVFWLGYPVTNAVGPFPLLVVGLRRLARDVDRRAVALTVVALLLILLAGHPEMLLFTVSAGGVVFLFALSRTEKGRRPKALVLALLAGALALGLSAVQLGPFLEALPQTWEHTFRSSWWAHQRKSAALVESAARAGTLAVPYAWGVSGHGRQAAGLETPGAYAGALLFPLAWTGLLFRGRPRAEWLTLLLLGLAVGARLAGPTDVVALLPLFDVGILDYLIFAAAFGLAILAALGAERLSRGEGRSAFLWGAAVSAAAILAIYASRRSDMRALEMPDDFLRMRLGWQLLPLAAVSTFVAGARRAGGSAAVGACLGVLVLSRFAEAGSVYPTMPPSAFYPRIAALDALPRGAPGRVVGLGPILIPNAATLYGLEDVRGYESMTFRPFYETYSLWSRPLPAWFNIVDDLDRPFLSFLNVRWALALPGTAPPRGWTLRASGPGAVLFENAAVLPRAFVPSLLRSVPERLANLKALGEIDDFARRGLLAEPGGPSEWTRNGEASVSIERYRPQSMTLAVDAREPSVVGTSVTAWKGWKARLDGAAAEPLLFNHAFLAFRVPAGRHRIELRYLPDGFRAGMIVSLLTLAGSVFLLRRPRAEPRRRSA